MTPIIKAITRIIHSVTFPPPGSLSLNFMFLFLPFIFPIFRRGRANVLIACPFHSIPPSREVSTSLLYRKQLYLIDMLQIAVGKFQDGIFRCFRFCFEVEKWDAGNC